MTGNPAGRKSIIFYFSGTGNSALIAKLTAQNIEFCEALTIEGYVHGDPVDAAVLGFVFPVYWWGLPNIVRRFISQLQIKSAEYVFTSVTMGSASGNAIPYVRELLAEKGIQLSAGFEYRMVDNYIIAHGAPGETTIRNKVENAAKKVLQDTKLIQERKTLPIKREKYWVKAINSHYIGTYRSLDKKFSVSDACIHCGLCERKCPVGNIKFINGTLTWNHQCESCMRCIQICPQKAINYADRTVKRERYFLDHNQGIDFIEGIIYPKGGSL